MIRRLMLLLSRTHFEKLGLLTLIAAMAITLLPVASADAQRTRLYKIADTRIDPSRASATIDVTDMRGAVRGLRVRTPSGALLLSNVRVVYANGDVFDERRRINLLRGERTRPIDPARRSRFVDRVILEINPNTADADSVRVQIFALQDRDGRRMRRPVDADETPIARRDPETNVATRRAPSTTDIAKSATETRRRASPSGTILDTDREPETTSLGRGEVLFGAQRVGLGLDRDVVRVGENVGRFRRIRLRVLENDVFLNAMTVVYRDGTSDALDVASELTRNTMSGWFNVAPKKFIQEVRLSYRSETSLRGRARVELFGEFSPGWLGTDGDGRNFNGGWVLLGAQTAGFVGFDDDVVPVGRNKGGFRQVQVRVRDRAITLNELQVVYGDGRADTVPIRTRVNAGSTWGPVDLKGDTQPIKEIRARYRSRFFDREAAGRGAAIVEIWGKY